MSLIITWGYGTSAVVPTAGYGGAIVSPCVPLFSLDSVEIQSAGVLRLRFTKPPLVGSGATSARADHAPNYVLTNEAGTVSPPVVLASVVSTDSEVIDLYLGSALTPDIWEISIAPTIESAGGATLTPPLEYRFELAEIDNPDLSDGAKNRTCVETLKAYFNPAFRAKPKWQPVLNAIAAGDCIVKEVVESARDQVWLSTASGRYLAQQASNYAISKPANTGISDDDFRRLALTIKNNKLSQYAFLRVLETVYGDTSTRAYIESDLGPYVLFEGAQLFLLIDDTETVDIRFTRSQFGIMRRATATEVAAVINTRLQEVASSAYAVSYTDPSTGSAYLRIFSGTLGLRSSISVQPSTAQIAFNFDTQLFGATTFTLPTWTLTQNGDYLRLRPSHGAVYDVRDIEIGDYVVILGAGFSAANRGAFTITDTYYGGISNQWVEVKTIGVPETVTQCEILDLQFYRPTRRTIHNSESRVIVTQTKQSTRIEIPTTTRIVRRDLDSASYLNENSSIGGVINRVGTEASITTATPHQLSPGDQFELVSDLDLVVPTISSETSSAGFDSNGEARGGSGFSDVSLWRQDTTFEGALFRAAQDTSGRAWVVGGQLEDVGTFTTITQAAVFDILESDQNSYSYQWTRRSTLFYTKPIGGALVAPTALALKAKMISSGGYTTDPWADYDPMFTSSDQGLLSKIVLDPPALVAEQFSSTQGLLAATGWFMTSNPVSGVFGVSDGVTSRTYGWGTGGNVTVTIGADVATSMANLVAAINSDGSAAWTAVLSTGFPEINSIVVIIIEDAVLAGRSGLRLFANASNLSDQRILKYATSTTSVVRGYEDPLVVIPDVIAPIYGIAGPHRDLPSLVDDETHYVLGINQYRHWNGLGWLSSFDWISEVPAGGLPNTVADHDAVRISDSTILISGGVNVPNLAVRDVVLYNQSTMSASPSGNLVEARAQHASVRLSDTEALIIGGRRPADDSLRAAQGYDTWDFGDAGATFSGPVTVGLGANRRVIGKIGHGLRFTFGPSVSTGGGDQTALNAQLLGDYTISGWMTSGTGVVFRNGVASPSGSANNTTIEFGVDPADNRFFVRWMYGSNIVITKKSTLSYTDLMGPTVLSPYPRYHHFAITKTNTASNAVVVELYIDGAVTDSWTDIRPDGGASGVWIFSDTDGAIPRFQGAIDEVGITSTVLTSEQILTQYCAEVGVMYDNPTGVDLSPIGTVLNTCEILTSGSSTLVSPMAYARFASGICVLPDGRILVVGGIGYRATQPRYDLSQRQSELRSAEIYDPYTKLWSQLPDMRDPHSYCLCELDLATNRIYVCGGFTSIRTEYLDLRTMKWGIGASIGSIRARGGGTKSGAVMLIPGGSDDIYNSYNTTNPHDAHFLPQSESVYGGGLNGIFTATAPTASTQISFRTPDHEGYSTGPVEIRRVAAAQDLKSSYLRDDTYSPTEVSGISQTEIRRGKAVTRLSLDTDEALAFGDTGHLIIAFGTSYQSPVLQYRRRGGSELDISGVIGSWDSFGTSTSIPAGAVVRQVKLAQTSYRPLISTAAEAGRNAAISVIESISAAGFDLDIVTRYPNDRGLGAEGWGSVDEKKSDKVWVWSGK